MLSVRSLTCFIEVDQCTKDCTGHVLHAHSDKDTMTDIDLALGTTTPVKEQDMKMLAPQE